MRIYQFAASCSLGIEALVAREVMGLGGQEVTTGQGVVHWQGGLESGYRCCLWSRFASRIFLLLDQFQVRDEEDLYQQCRHLDWLKIFACTTSFAVNATVGKDSPVGHSRFAALRVKDAIVDSFREALADRPPVQVNRPAIQFHLHLEAGEATVAIDLSGESLHRRGYRVDSGKAPLKENLAAAIVALSGWDSNGETLLDPMCGTGTLLIEAAMIYGDIAPGLSRSYFGFSGWLQHEEGLWSSLIEEAVNREEAGALQPWPTLLGYDCDPQAVTAARKNIAKAGLQEHIRINVAELATCNPPSSQGVVLSNLPFGERLSETEVVAQLYRAIGRILSQRFVGWRVSLFISQPELIDYFALPFAGSHKLFNGSIACRLLNGTVQALPETEWSWQIRPKNDNDDELVNRLRKNLKKMLTWARSQKLECFRIYDRDLPEYAAAIDLYGKWIHIQEYAPPKSIDSQLAAERFSHLVRSVKDLLGVRSDRVFLKTRSRQRGKKQYEKTAEKKKLHLVREGDAYFLVNFTDYLDTGLFLDHRPLRLRLGQEAKGKDFLNLFGYTGSATIHAAVGGARSTTTVDLSANYLQWARKNLALNGFGEVDHRLEKADCLEWLQRCERKYDLIFLDPPTFSNTAKKKRVFDVQRDHSQLIASSMARLHRYGVLYFSTNYKSFKLDHQVSERFVVQEISNQTIGLDFERQRHIHRCYLIRHVADSR